jgi:hypothetical protein
MLHLMEKGKTWTALYDTDEFLVFDKYDHKYNGDDDLKTPSDMSKPGAVLEFLEKAQTKGSQDPTSNDICHSIPRLLFGTKELSEDELASSVPQGVTVDPSRLDTLRWRYRYPDTAIVHNGPGKTIIDVSRLGPYVPFEVQNPHRPLVALCIMGSRYNDTKSSPFRVNHYLGSWEAFSFRDDARKGGQRSKEIWEFHSNCSTVKRSDEAATWLVGFRNHVGVDKANAVLNEAGIPKSYIPKHDEGWTFQEEKFSQDAPKPFLEFLRAKSGSNRTEHA